eukprot:Hpha_TRINITY_DN3732_c0_g1::TRINITY_DN3732_c0_g1_i1::g.23854::m.23854
MTATALRIRALLLVVAACARHSAAAANAPPTTISIDTSQNTTRGFALGGNTFTTTGPDPAVAGLGLRMLRVWKIVDTWPQYPINATAAEMDAFVGKIVTPQLATQYRDLFANLTAQNITLLISGNDMPPNYVDHRNQLLPARADDVALLWEAWVARLSSPDIGLPPRHFIELSNEPNGNWSVEIDPATWTKLACSVRDRLDARNLTQSGISGPGCSIAVGQPFFAAIRAANASRCLAIVSTHSWEMSLSDPCGPHCMVETLADFDRLRRELDPTHSKVWAATEYGTRTGVIMGKHFRVPVATKPSAGTCYANSSVTALPPDAESLSPVYAARVLAMTLAHINTNFDAALYWWLHDYSFTGFCFGLTARDGRNTAAFA